MAYRRPAAVHYHTVQQALTPMHLSVCTQAAQ